MIDPVPNGLGPAGTNETHVRVVVDDGQVVLRLFGDPVDVAILPSDIDRAIEALEYRTDEATVQTLGTEESGELEIGACGSAEPNHYDVRLAWRSAATNQFGAPAQERLAWISDDDARLLAARLREHTPARNQE